MGRGESALLCALSAKPIKRSPGDDSSTARQRALLTSTHPTNSTVDVGWVELKARFFARFQRNPSNAARAMMGFVNSAARRAVDFNPSYEQVSLCKGGNGPRGTLLHLSMD